MNSHDAEEHDEDDSKLPSITDANRHSDDDDDDNWSRQVETDDTVAAGGLHGDESASLRMESVIEQERQQQNKQRMADLDVGVNGEGGVEDTNGLVRLAPTQPELTMKEKLVLRERQRRIETERARLKRQFALNNAIDHDSGAANLQAAGGGVLSEAAVRDNGSAAGTLGEESTKAHPDEDQESADQEKLGFNMERFLRNSDNFNPELEATDENKPTAPDQGPVMERFLSEPVVTLVESEAKTEPLAPETDVHRSVSFDLDAPNTASELGHGEAEESHILIAGSLPSFNETTPSIDANISVLVHADEDDVARDPLITSMGSMDAQESALSIEAGLTPSADEPRFLRLTEADMQEMAAIEEASIGNAPPSDRTEEDLSEIGELADFGGHIIHDDAGNVSQDTQTTAVESASILSGNQSGRPASATSDRDHIVDQQSLDGMPSTSVSSQLLVSPGAGANQQSDIATDDGPLYTGIIGLGSHHEAQGSAGLAVQQPILVLDEDDMILQPRDRVDSDGANSEGLVNRRLRPGMGNQTTARPAPKGPPAALQPPASPVVVEGFDFDKDEPMTPGTDHGDSLRDLPEDVWSPAGNMSVSPMQVRGSAPLPPTEEEEPSQSRTYGSMDDRRGLPFAPINTSRNEESKPLLGDVPPEIITTRQATQDASGSEFPSRSIVQVALEGVQAGQEHEKENGLDKAALYDSKSTLKRAFPDRMVVLCATLLVEIPVLLMISGGSGALCGLIGSKRYHLLVGMIPLTNAISGNVGLQASSLTTRAISHSRVKVGSYGRWFVSEVGTAAYLGLGMGCLVGGIALLASEMDFAFALTIMIAQFISIVAAGVTGTFAPLLFSFVFKGDSGKWAAPLETAFQDVVGSFALIVVCYYLLAWLGAGSVDASDSCGTVS